MIYCFSCGHKTTTPYRNKHHTTIRCPVDGCRLVGRIITCQTCGEGFYSKGVSGYGARLCLDCRQYHTQEKVCKLLDVPIEEVEALIADGALRTTRAHGQDLIKKTEYHRYRQNKNNPGNREKQMVDLSRCFRVDCKHYSTCGRRHTAGCEDYEVSFNQWMQERIVPNETFGVVGGEG